MDVNWDEIVTLRNRSSGYDIRIDPLWICVITAKQGHEGYLEDMEIEMIDGTLFGPEAIQALAARPDRKWGE